MVAKDALAKESLSKIILLYLVILIISEFYRQSFLLSSNTVFILSIQIASIGPSNINQLGLSY